MGRHDYDRLAPPGTAAPDAPTGATRLVAGVLVPDTPLITRAIAFAQEHSEPYLFNHVMRSWLFAVSLARLRETPHDAEVLAVATLLHDIGLARAFDGPLRFEVEGANAAKQFALREGLDEIVATRPATTYDNFARDFGERFVPRYERPSTVDFLLNSPFVE
jgi:hypothetical protein